MNDFSNERNNHILLDDILKSSQKKLSDSIRDIESLANTVDAARLFVAVFANMCFGPAEAMTESTHGTVPVKIELLSYYLYPFFCLSNNNEITPFHVNECMEALDKIHNYSWTEELFFDPEKYSNPVDAIAAKIRMRAMNIRGSAYPEQTRDEILSIQGVFEDWFAKRLGIGPTRASVILYAILKRQEDNYNDNLNHFREHADSFAAQWKEAKKKWLKNKSEEKPKILQVLKKKKTAWLFGYCKRLNELAPDILPVGRTDLDIECLPSIDEWEALKNLIGLTKVIRENMSTPLGVRERNLFFMPDDRVILADISHSLDLIWESFEKVARGDQNFYDKRFQKKKSQWLEDRAAEHLSKMFPQERIFRKLDYSDPYKPDSSVAELDIAVDWGPFLLLIEVKARQFRIESQLGDVGRLRTDMKLNIEDAFRQARRAGNYISSSTSPEFLERGTGRKLTITKSSVRRIYMITVSQHNLAGLATELTSLKELGLFKDEEYPISVSEGDLDIISELCTTPDMFLHYLERRLDIQKQSIEIVADELDYFGAYLACRLQASRLWEGEEGAVDYVALVGCSDIFDQWIMYKRGQLDKPPEIYLKIPNEIKEILSELRDHNNDSARWIAFALLDMSDDQLGIIANSFRELRDAKLTPGIFRRMVYKDGDTVISLTASLDIPAMILRSRNAFRVQVEKYKHKALKSIGFGIMILNKKRLFDCAAYAEGPWKYNEELEKVVSEEPPYTLVPGQKLPSKESPCLCGNGKKFMECCLLKYIK